MEFSIKDRRNELGLTMKEVADYVGVSEATVSRWESGSIANMKRSRVQALAEVLKVSPLDILGTEDPIGDKYAALQQAYDARPEIRILFDSAEDATAEQIMMTVKVLEAFKKND